MAAAYGQYVLEALILAGVVVKIVWVRKPATHRNIKFIHRNLRVLNTGG
jgi:hypothetical protein